MKSVESIISTIILLNFLTLQIAAADPAPPFTYFQYSKAFKSKTRQSMTIYTRSASDKIAPNSPSSDPNYSGACTFSYGGSSEPKLNENVLTHPSFPEYLTNEQRDQLFIKNTEFTIFATVDFGHPSTYSTVPKYSVVPHLCELTPTQFKRNDQATFRNKTIIGNTDNSSNPSGSFIQLLSASKNEALFNFEFKQDRIVMSTKSQNWWKDTFGWSENFYPNFAQIGSFHGPQASIGFRNGAMLNSQPAIGKFAHLFLEYTLENNLNHSQFQNDPFGVNIAPYSHSNVPTTGQTNYLASKHGGGLRFGITFRFLDDQTFCQTNPSTMKTYQFNLVENIYDERFEYIDQDSVGNIMPNFEPLAIDPATGQAMYRFPLRRLLNYEQYKTNLGFHFNPFKIRGIKVSIKDVDLLPILKNEVIPNLIAKGFFPGCPNKPKDTLDINAYSNFIVNHTFVPTASTGFETGGINDLNFSLFEFSLVGH